MKQALIFVARVIYVAVRICFALAVVIVISSFRALARSKMTSKQQR
jgi:hypothetical protein